MDKFWDKVLEVIVTIIILGIVVLIGRDFFMGTIGEKSIIFSCLNAIWNVIEAVLLFFIGIFSKIGSFFTSIGNGITWILGKVGALLNPIMEALPDSPIVPFILFLSLGTLFLMLKLPGTTVNQSSFDRFARLSYGWCSAAINLGIVIAGSSNPRIWMSGAFDAYVIEVPMTLLNIAEWTGFARTMLFFTLIGGVILSLIFAAEKNPRYIIRSWVGLAMCCSMGYGYMNIRLAVTYWLADNLGFIGRLLNIPVGLFEFFLLIQVYLGLVVFLIPLEALNETSKTIEAMESVSSESTSSNGNNPTYLASDNFPTYVSDDAGNHYSVRLDGDFLYISLPTGEISTKWEYVEGQSYYIVNGKRFYPHT